jgi:hypothetical protein
MYPKRFAALAGMPNMDEAAIASFLSNLSRNKLANIRLFVVCHESLNVDTTEYKGFFGLLEYDYSDKKIDQPQFYEVVAHYKDSSSFSFQPNEIKGLLPPKLKSDYEEIAKVYWDRTTVS